MNGITTKEIIIVNNLTKESIKAGTSQKFTKSVLMDVIKSGKYFDFLLSAYDSRQNKNPEYDITYKGKVLYLGEFAYLKYN
jgi:hypothetical protein